jgi:hypothetical protein
MMSITLYGLQASPLVPVARGFYAVWETEAVFNSR